MLARPVVGNTLMFKEGRHPLLDYHLKDKCVPNDTYLTPEAHFGIITGPNMVCSYIIYITSICRVENQLIYVRFVSSVFWLRSGV